MKRLGPRGNGAARLAHENRLKGTLMYRRSSSQAARSLRRRARRVRQAVEIAGLVSAAGTVAEAASSHTGGATVPNNSEPVHQASMSVVHAAASAAASATPTPTPTTGTGAGGGWLVHLIEHPPGTLEEVGLGFGVAAVGAGALWAQAVWRSQQEQARSGYATKRQLRRTLSAKAVFKDVSTQLPRLENLTKEERRKLPTSEYAVELGGSLVPRMPLYCAYKDVVLVLGPAQQGKSSLLARTILRAPGSVLSTCTKLDLYRSTSEYRSQFGRIWLMNPEGQGGIPINFRWSPVSGCENPVVAMERAAAMISAAGDNADVTDAGYWKEMGTQLLACLLHAAALGGCDMRKVWEWANNPSTLEPGRHLEDDRAGHGWAAQLKSMQLLDPKQTGSIYSTMRRGIAFMLNPQLAQMALPAEGEGIDIDAFILSRDSIYLVGEDTPGTSVAPYFLAFVTTVHTRAKRLATQQPGGRLDPSILFALDELALICPIPLDRWAADSGGRGISIWGCCQAVSQLDQKYGREAARTIWAASNVHIILGGVKDHEYIEGISRMIGDREVDVVAQSQQSSWQGGRTSSTSTHPQLRRAIPPQDIVQLEKWTALVLYRNLPPVRVSYLPIWKDPEIRRMEKEKKRAQRAGAGA